MELLKMLLPLALMIGAMSLGLVIRARLPDHHRTTDAQDAVVRAVGVVVTLTSLVLGLVVAQAQQYYESIRTEVVEIAADVSAADSVLERIGPQTAAARQLLRDGVDEAVASVWRGGSTAPREPQSYAATELMPRLSDAVLALPQGDSRQAALQTQAVALVADMQLASYKLQRTRQSGADPALMAVLLSWLVIVYLGLGLVMPRTPTAITTTVLSAAACSGALFLVIEYYTPVSGLVHISSSILGGALTR